MTINRGQRPYMLAIVAIMSVCAPIDAQVLFDGSGGDNTPVALGSFTTVEVHGPPNTNFMLFGGAVPADYDTPIGTLGVDVYDPSFRIGIDGLTYGSPTFNMGWTNGTGAAGFTIIPFVNNSALGAEIYGQAAFIDPTNIFGVSLTNRAGIVATAAAPQIETVAPHSAVPGQPVTIQGCNLGGAANNGAPPVVMLNDIALQVLNHDSSCVEVMIPSAAKSGSIVVSTVGGVTALSEEGWPSWVSVYGGALAGESAAAGTTLNGPHAIIGDIYNQQDVDTYSVAVNEGDELFCEVQTYDPAIVDLRRHDPADLYGGGLNPYVRIMVPGYPVTHIVADDDGGPLFAAAIGFGTGGSFVAPLTGTIQIIVESRFNLTWGEYVLNFWTAPTSPNTPPELMVVHPNIAPPGTAVEILASGMSPLAPPAAVIFPGPYQTTVEVAPYRDENGKLFVQIPVTAESGPLRVRNSAGIVSTIAAESFPQFLMVQRNGRFEAQTTVVVDDDQVLGDITNLFEADTYLINLNAGDRLHLHCAPFDFVSMRMLEGRAFVAGLLDPHIVIRDPASGAVYQADNNAGPGTSAMIGGMAGNPFVAPAAMQVEILVRGFLTISTGTYILDVKVD